VCSSDLGYDGTAVSNGVVGGNGGGQTAGGAGVAASGYNSSAGSFGAGSNGASNANASGGGGGYYGGSGGARQSYTVSATGAGGGSAFVSGMPGCVAIDPTATNNPRTPDTGNDPTALNYSNATFGASPTWADGEEIRFTGISMVDGAGYEWSSGAKAGAVTGMPNWSKTDGTTMTGNTGAGHARITCLTCQP
jgi:hypothetical protein